MDINNYHLIIFFSCVCNSDLCICRGGEEEMVVVVLSHLALGFYTTWYSYRSLDIHL